MKVTTIRLPYGVAFDGRRIVPAGKALPAYTLTLLEPVDGVTEVTVRAATLRDALEVQGEVTANHAPGTLAYAEAVFRAHLKRRATPELTNRQLDQLSGPDHDALRGLVDGGYQPDGKRAHLGGSGLERDAYARLHFMADRKKAEQALPTSRADNPMLYEAKLTHQVVRFGAVDASGFDAAPVEWAEFINIAFADYVALSMAVMGRDYKEITEVLDGAVEVDGKTLPFPGDAGDDPQEAAA